MSFSPRVPTVMRRVARSQALIRQPLSSSSALFSFANPSSASLCVPSSSALPSISSSSSLLHRSFFSRAKTSAADAETQQSTPSSSASSSTDSTTSSSSPSSSTASSSSPTSDSTATSSSSTSSFSSSSPAANASSTPSSASASSSTSSPPPPPPSSAELAEKTKALGEMEGKYKETYDRLLRSAAEIENVRRTSRMDVDNARKYAATGFAKSMLEVADTLELAAKSAKEALAKAGEGGGAAGASTSQSGQGAGESAVVQSLLEGIEMTEKVLAKALSDHGISKMEAMGHKFSPHEHHALFEVEDEGKEPGSIAHVMKQGYKYNDRVLRAAQVGTVKKR